MENGPPKSVFFHFRFKFLAISMIAFLIYVVLSSSAEFDQFASTPQFKMLGPFLLIVAVSYFLFRKFPIRCPHCFKLLTTKVDWKCPDCGKQQGRKRYLVDKCIHCKQLLTTYACKHCEKPFKL